MIATILLKGLSNDFYGHYFLTVYCSSRRSLLSGLIRRYIVYDSQLRMVWGPDSRFDCTAFNELAINPPLTPYDADQGRSKYSGRLEMNSGQAVWI